MPPEYDRLHWTPAADFPGRLDAYEAAAFLGAVEAMNRVARRYRMPLTGFRGRVQDGRAMLAVVPPAAGEEEMASLQAAHEREAGPVRDAIEALWRERWLPEAVALLAALRQDDLHLARLDELLERLSDAERRSERLWEIHYEIAFASPFSPRAAESRTCARRARAEVREVVLAIGRWMADAGIVSEPAGALGLTPAELRSIVSYG
jgi:hypothetical protein